MRRGKREKKSTKSRDSRCFRPIASTLGGSFCPGVGQTLRESGENERSDEGQSDCGDGSGAGNWVRVRKAAGVGGGEGGVGRPPTGKRRRGSRKDPAGGRRSDLSRRGRDKRKRVRAIDGGGGYDVRKTGRAGEQCGMVPAGDPGGDDDGALGPGDAIEFARRILLLQTWGAPHAAREGRQHRKHGVNLRAAEFAEFGGIRSG